MEDRFFFLQVRMEIKPQRQNVDAVNGFLKNDLSYAADD